MTKTQIELVAFDIEGTLTTDPTVWEIMHRKLGTWESHGLVYWERYRRRELEYDDFARLDVGVWKDTPLSELEDAARQVPLMPGVDEVLPALTEAGLTIALISNGLTVLGRRIADEYGVEHVFANRALHSDGNLTGELDLTVPYAEKGVILEGLISRLGLSRENVAAVGDDRADIAMFRRAGISVAFRPGDPETAGEAQTVIDDPRQLPPLIL